MKYRKEKSYWQRDIRKTEYLKLMIESIVIIVILSYVFYGTFLGAIFCFPILVGYYRIRRAELIKKKHTLFRLQFKDAIQSISAALHVGYSAENAVKEAQKELQILYKKEERILEELRYMVHQLDMNIPLEKVFLELAVRTKDEDVRTFSTVFSMAKRSGGDMIAIIGNTVRRIMEKIDLQREMETVIAAKKLEFRIMTVIPLAILCYMKISFPEFLDVLYANVMGIILMTVCLLVYVVTYIAGKRIVEMEV